MNKFKSVVFITSGHHELFDPLIDAICSYGNIENKFVFFTSSNAELNNDLYQIVKSQNATCLCMCGEYIINLDLLKKLNNLFLIRVGGDDEFFFDVYTKDMSRYFDVNLTTSHECYVEMIGMGVNSIHMPQMYKISKEFKENNEMHDVSFCGRVDIKHGRRQFIDSLIDTGVNLHIFGQGTTRGVLDEKEMLKLFSNSKINLNFSGVDSNKTYISKITGSDLTTKKQLKGRIFLIMHQGGFVMTEDFPDLKYTFEPGIDLVTFKTPTDLVRLVSYYLSHEDERETIRKKGAETVKKYAYDTFAPELLRQLFLHKKSTVPIKRVGPWCSKYIAFILSKQGLRNIKTNFLTSLSYGYLAGLWYFFYLGLYLVKVPLRIIRIIARRLR
jgi:hypothetical protein